MVGIYKITNPVGKVYIGQSVNIENRWKTYKDLKCASQPKLYNSLCIYGAVFHKFEVLIECEKRHLNLMESFYMLQFPLFNLLNIKIETNTNPKAILSKEIRKDMWESYLKRQLNKPSSLHVQPINSKRIKKGLDKDKAKQRQYDARQLRLKSFYDEQEMLINSGIAVKLLYGFENGVYHKIKTVFY